MRRRLVQDAEATPEGGAAKMTEIEVERSESQRKRHRRQLRQAEGREVELLRGVD